MRERESAKQSLVLPGYIKQHENCKQKRPPNNDRDDESVVQMHIKYAYVHRYIHTYVESLRYHPKLEQCTSALEHATHKTSQCVHIRRQWYKWTYV